MGIGDELMAAGMARKYREEHGRPVAIVDHAGRVRTHDIWQDNPDIARCLGPGVVRLLNCGGHRPYIANKTATQWTWRAFKPTPARLILAGSEVDWGARYAGRILVEPNVKHTGHRNKDWGFDRWQELVARRPGAFVQVGYGDFKRLEGVEVVVTPTFRLACAVLKASLMYVGPEGGLHHAAAALERPAIVLFGGFISPDVTGYPNHRNLFTGGKACGMRIDCQHCRDAMAKITVEQVDQQIGEVLRNEVR